jgi:hypothetical protein
MIVALFASIAGNVAMALSIRRTQKREVSFGFAPASKEDFDKHIEWNRLEHVELFNRLNSMTNDCSGRMASLNRELQGDFKKSTDAIHERVNQVLKAVSRLEGKIDLMEERR